MKRLRTILAGLACVLTALCLVRIKLRIRYRDALKVELYAGPVSLNKYLDGSRKSKKSKKQKKKGKIAEAHSENKEKKSLTDSLSEILEILKAFTSRFFGHVRVRFSRIVISVGGKDPAKTALYYGVVSQTVAYIVEILKRNTKFSPGRGSIAIVEPDFVSGKSNVDIDITLTVSVGGAIHALLAAAWTYIFK